MTDWTQITAAAEGAIGAIVVVAPFAIKAWFNIKAQIDAAKTEAEKRSAVNSARIDVHDVKSGVDTSNVQPIGSAVPDPRPIPQNYTFVGSLDDKARPIQPMPAMPVSKITTP